MLLQPDVLDDSLGLQQLALTGRPLEAQASTRPCELYAHSGVPRPSRTQGHHLHPVYLQQRKYGQVRDPQLAWLCGLCHDSVHDWVSYLLGEARIPSPVPGWKARALAADTVAWFHS